MAKKLRWTATHCPHGHEVSEATLRRNKAGHRVCTICEAQRLQAQAEGMRIYASSRVDPAQVATFRAVDEAGLLDELLMHRAGFELKPVVDDDETAA